MSEKKTTETKARAPRRTDAEIAADYERKAEEAKKRAKLRGTPGLRALIEAKALLLAAHAETPDGAPHKAAISNLSVSLTDLVARLQK